MAVARNLPDVLATVGTEMTQGSQAGSDPRVPAIGAVRSWAPVFLIAAAAAGVTLFDDALFRDWRWEHHPLHAFMEGVGALCAFVLVGLLLILRGYGRLADTSIWVIAALIGMGVLDSFHAATHAGSLFVWLHSLATLLGGILFAGIWLPPVITGRLPVQGVTKLMLLGTLLVGLLSVSYPAALPPMLTENGFSLFAKAVNTLGGVGFLAAGLHFVLFKWEERSDAGIVFANHCLIFGIAAFLFGQSNLWDFTWWLWHALRLVAYAVALYFFFELYRSSQEELREARDSLELRVAQRSAELRESEERVRLLLDSAGEAIYGVDLDGNCTFANAACGRTFGYTQPGVLLGRNMHALTHHTRPDGTPYSERECKIRQAHREGRGVHVDDELLWRADGSSFAAEYWSYPMRQDGDVVGAVVICVDITKRKQAELVLARQTADLAVAKARAEESDRLKSVFMATMSHELRTPLNSIIGFTGILLQGLAGEINQEQKKQLVMVQTSARELLSLIIRVLDISKIEAGRLDVSSGPFDIGELVKDVVETLKPEAANKGLVLRTRIAPAVGQINSDMRRVEQILLNLVDNAVKFTREGEVLVVCEVVDQQLWVQVNDTGIGIEEKDMIKLFHPFQQLDDRGTTRKHDGTGLGLAFSRKLARLLGGDIRAESEGGAGSTFTLIMPLQPDAESLAVGEHLVH